MASVTIPDSVTNLESQAFLNCANLAGVYFQGNAPSLGSSVFAGANSAIIYYLAGTTGWDTTFAGRPTVLYSPQPQPSVTRIGVQANQFGFDITGTSGLVVVVEACMDLAQPVWLPAGTNTLADGASYFCDPQWTNYPGCFYRLRSQ